MGLSNLAVVAAVHEESHDSIHAHFPMSPQATSECLMCPTDHVCHFQKYEIGAEAGEMAIRCNTYSGM